MGFTKNTLGLWAILGVFPSMPEGLLAAEKSAKLAQPPPPEPVFDFSFAQKISDSLK